ncbi:M48 family metallopeptidase [Lysobacter solisilvae (ex Woo and Kim 2020)]|uniref:M48 family metallopeptidase n=1 Tax=Agrilutibacter terrestris TaxID=2865112 RepID=A0A7H0FYW9_9GAMM|nr:M48 family metallopeptidase [Lysobacter terrestris]QNP41235.1 M48 family metallopeptidase [Lysobacter terrestris]
MNFFEHQATARRHSFRLVLLFAVAVAGIVLAVDAAAWLVFANADALPGETATMLVFTTLVTLGIIGLGSLYRVATLRGGGESIALQMGGVAVPEQGNDFHLRRLRNVVEEIAIASGVPMPRLYVLEHEAAINAFAAGYSPSDAVVAVTRGALERLNRDELQGVIAHEFSHILNGDMRLNIRLIGVLFGILMLAIIGRKVLELGRGRDRNAGAILVAALIAMVVGYIGLFFGRLIKAGVSRSRERLADASAVQFTRQTSGLAGALKKIGGVDAGSKLSHRGDAEEISHMLFGDGVGLRSWFATHPPLVERIQALEPGFSDEQLLRLSLQWHANPPSGLEEDAQLGFTGAVVPPPLPAATAEQAVTPAAVAAQVAQPGADDYRRADAIAAHIPADLRALATQRESVVPLLLGLLFDAQPAVVDKQGDEISARMGKTVALEARRLHQQFLATLHPALRLPLASLAFPVLRLRPRPELDVFLDTVNAMVYTDGIVSLFEYCLARLLTVHVRESLDPSRYARFGRRKLSEVRSEIATLLAVVAQSGNADADAARKAYLAGIQRVMPDQAMPYLARPNGVLALDDAWMPLDALEPLAKEVLVEAITATIGHDGRVSIAEAELLRTICSTLHCPLPPLLGKAA